MHKINLLVCPFCGGEANISRFQWLALPMVGSSGYVRIYRCVECRKLFAPLDNNAVNNIH